MSFQTPITIVDALQRIRRHDFVLPAIQREFVWRPKQIARLFDSLMQGYPVGSFLFWHVERENVHEYKFYDFVRNYHQKDRPHCPPIDVPSNQSVIAVLDGQQRLTALNIGLRGSHALKEPRKRWSNPDAFPEKHLYLNIAQNADDNEGALTYDFRFLPKERAQPSTDQHWFRVGKILDFEDSTDIYEFIQDADLAMNRNAFRMLNRLHNVVHSEKTIAYFQETEQNLDKVLNIFIRTNSGGTILSYSDLLLSIATAQWEKLDARKEIHNLVDELNDTHPGFTFSKDFVLKAGLMLTDIGSVGFKVTNFNRANMAVLENNWSNIAQALKIAVQLVANFGFTSQTLSADNALLPVAYSLYQRQLDEHYLTSSTFLEDREAIRGWLTRSLLKSGIWGSGLDTTLTAIRATLREHGTGNFPVEAIESTMRSRGKGLRFEEEELEDLLDVTYGDRRVFLLLSLLFPFHDFRHEYHIDHIFPRTRFTESRLATDHIPSEDHTDLIDRVNRLPNLQLLEGTLNKEKSATLPHEWLTRTLLDENHRKAFIERHLLHKIPDSILGFQPFYDIRRQALLNRLRSLLDVVEPTTTVLETT